MNKAGRKSGGNCRTCKNEKQRRLNARNRGHLDMTDVLADLAIIEGRA